MTPLFDEGADIFETSENESVSEIAVKRRRNHSGGEQSKGIELIAQQIKDAQARKMELLEKMVTSNGNQEQSELQLFFASMCKTVEKFTPLNQAKIKMQITKIVNEMEILHLETQEEFLYIPVVNE